MMKPRKNEEEYKSIYEQVQILQDRLKQMDSEIKITPIPTQPLYDLPKFESPQERTIPINRTVTPPSYDDQESIPISLAASEVLKELKNIKILTIGMTVGSLLIYGLSILHKYAGVVAAVGMIAFGAFFLFKAQRRIVELTNKYFKSQIQQKKGF
jgi:hypothetical protein